MNITYHKSGHYESLSPDRKIDCIYWAHLSMFYIKTEAELSLLIVVLEIKYRIMDNVQNCDWL
jgi:hypothetical protein